MLQKRGLGKGLETLIPPLTQTSTTKTGGLKTIPIDTIVPNRLQPRLVFDDEKIRELADSIREDGILQPLIVSSIPDGRFELVAGERRLRAARVAGLSDVPVIIKDVDDTGMLALSLIENIQREDLNPLEESAAYQELIEQFNLTQEDVAKRVGKSRTAVANSLRLLKLPRVIQEDVSSGRYSAGHARAILALEGTHSQLKLREWIVRNTPTVRNVEHKVSYLRNGRGPTRSKGEVSPQIASIATKMRETLGTKVSITPTRKGGGKITIDYYSNQDLDRLYRQITANI